MSKINNSKKASPSKPQSPLEATVKPVAAAGSGTPFYLNPWLIGSLLMVLTYLAFRSAFGNDFVSWDDPVYVQENMMVLQKNYEALKRSIISLNYHPLTMFSLVFDVPEEGDLTAAPFIRTNVILHALNVLLAFLLSYKLSNKHVWASLFVAFMFAVHPMKVESVVWVSERKDVLYGFFFLAASLVYLRFLDTQKWIWYAFALLLFVLSCLSKAMAVPLPLVLLLLGYYAKDESLLDIKKWVRLAPFFIVAMFFGVMTLKIQAGDNFFGFFEQTELFSQAIATNIFKPYQTLMFGCYGFAQYLYHFFVPIGLCTYYPYPFENEVNTFTYTFPVFVVAAVLAGTVWAWMKGYKEVVFGMGWFIATVALVLQFISVGSVIMADRYTYLPYFGVSFMVAMLVVRALSSNLTVGKGLQIAAGLLMLFCIYRLPAQIATWKDSEALWTNVIQYYPRAEHPYANRGNWYGKHSSKLAQDNNPTEANLYLNKAIADLRMAESLGSTRAAVFEGLGNAYGIRGNLDSAIYMFNRALHFDKNMGGAFFNRAIAKIQKQQFTDAIKDLEQALIIMPLKAHTILGPIGHCYMNLGDYAKGADYLTKAIEKGDTKTPNTYFNRAIAYINLGQTELARRDLQTTLQLDPNHQAARNQLANLK